MWALSITLHQGFWERCVLLGQNLQGGKPGREAEEQGEVEGGLGGWL